MSVEIKVDDATLGPLVKKITRHVIEQLDEERAVLSGKIGFTLPEAASRLGIKPHVLRDARTRGEIRGRMVGKRIIFSREELLRFVNETDD